MADEFTFQAADDDGDELDDSAAPWELSKERIVVLIDADASMLDTCPGQGEDQTYLAWAVECAATIMATRIRTSPKDEIAVVFYSAARQGEAEGRRVFEHVHPYVRLDTPDAATIRRLQEFSVADFEAEVGVTNARITPGQAAVDLRSGLYACWDLFNSRSAGASSSKARVAKTVWLFTNNDDPLAQAGPQADSYRDQLLGRAAELGGLAAKLDVIPLCQLADSSSFDLSRFWQPLLNECKAAARRIGGALAWEGAAAAQDMEEEEEQLQIARVSAARGAHRKRHLGKLEWQVSARLRIAVKLYALISPAHRPAPIYLTAESNEEVRRSNRLIDGDTGGMLQAVSHRSFSAKTGAADRFPKVILENDEVSELKQLRPPGLTLLGFKPASALQEWHQVSPARFVYPDELAGRGSTAAFVALHAACLPAQGEPQLPVCSYVRQRGSMPLLVALLPQREVLEAESGSQVEPPGFHMVCLPYADDLRAPESEPAAAGKASAAGEGPPRATAEQVAAAVRLINALSLDEEAAANLSDIPNPHLQRQFEVLEALALGDAVPPVSDLADATAPDYAEIDSHQGLLDGFKAAVWGSTQGPAQQAAGPAGTKRKRAVASELAARIAGDAGTDWVALAADDDGKRAGLSGLTKARLEVFLRHHGLTTTGNKAELVARIKRELDSSSAGGAALP